MNFFCLRTWNAWVLLFLFFNMEANGQVGFNEICPTNITGIVNSNGKNDDWIELHNSGGSTVNLAGYGLTDDPTNPFRFTFPSYNVNSGKKALVFASDSTVQGLVDHWEMSVNAQSSWKYVVGSAAIDTNWRNLSFNQASWSSGNGGIGYGDGDDATVVPVCASVMMRKTFTITDTSQILKVVFMMDYDDAFVAYLNGVEIARSNIGFSGVRPAWNALANSVHEAQMYQSLQPDSFFILPSVFNQLLKNGTNVLAVETHNKTATDNDLSSIPYLFFGMSTSATTYSPVPSWFRAPTKEYFNAKFKLSRYGETLYFYNPSGTLIDQVTYPSLEIDNSYCRKPDGSANWCYVFIPTPNATNNSSICYTGYANVPVFSRQGGFYSATETITLTNSTPGGVIRYTTNGNTPNISSAIYSSPIIISSSTVIRAVVFASGYLPSPLITNSYIINANSNLSTFSITTDSLNLWDYNTGIYVMGPNASSTTPFFGANFWQDWEKPATIEYYDKNKNLVVRFDADIKIYGNYSRAHAQKSFEIKLSDKYGAGEFIYPIYPDKQYVDKINNIVLRNSGTDWNNVHFRDAMMERILKTTNTGYLAAEPAVAYLNGSYWGVYQLNENHDHHWMKNNFGLGKSEIDYLKEFGSNIKIQEGSDASFWDLYNYATVQSPLTQQYYDYFNERFDLKNYTDYFVAETFYNNGDWIGDWTNNIQMWRPNAPGSKLRYFVYDLDFGLALYGNVNDDRLAIARTPAAFSYSSRMFDAILNNPTYKRDFINRYADLLNTIFLPSNIDAYMKSFRDTMSYDMPAHFAKWGSNMTTWQSNITTMMNFANARPAKMRNFINTDFGLGGQVTLTLQASPAGSGRIEISTITPTSLPWSGIYFKGNPVTITAIPNPGFIFDHWRSQNIITSNNFNQSVTYDFTSSDVVTAYFTGSSTTAKMCVSELNYNPDSAYNAGDWIELHNYGTTILNISGWRLSDGNDNHNYYFPTGTVIAPNGYLVITEDSVKFKSQFPTVTNRIGPLGFNFGNAGDQIRLFNHLNTLYLSFFYQDISPWPVLADGLGYTCELSANTADPNNGSNWFAGCIGGSPGRAFSSNLSIPVTITGSTTFCSGNTVDLNATNVSVYTYQWRNNNINIPGATSSTYTANSSGSYTVRITSQGCSTVSDPTVITVVSQHPAPQTTSDSRCGSGALTLTATSSDTVFWFDSSVGGNLLGSGNTFMTGIISQTTNYYARTGSSCQSVSTEASATIIPITAVPVTSDGNRCGPGTVALTASGNPSLRWYNAFSGGGLLYTGGTYTTNILNSDTSFYVEAGTTCPSQRVEVHVIVNTSPVPSAYDSSRCGSGAITLTANSPSPISWYSSQSGGTLLGTGPSFTRTLSATDTFYVEANGGCPSVRVVAIAIIIPIPPNPVAPDVTICSTGEVTLTATATQQVYWYDAASGGNLLYTGSVFTTPFLSATQTFYAVTGYNCLSGMVPVQAIISSYPPAPTSANVNRCGTGTVTLNATSTEQINWYNSASGGTVLGTGSTFVTPVISVTTNYYAEAGNACRSSRTVAQAIVDPVPAIPVANNVARCNSGIVTLTATSPQQIYWYTVASGGTSVGTGSTYTTPVLTTTTTYYLETGDNCRSARISVQAIVNGTGATPVLSDVARCGPGVLTITANSSSTVYWFSSSSGGTSIGTGLTFTTPSLNSTTTYYAEAGPVGCVSARVSVQAFINPIPAAPTGSDSSRCGSGTVVLAASSGSQIFWYASSVSTAILDSGATFTTPFITSTKNYYAESNKNSCGSSRILIKAIIDAIPSAPVANDISRCGSGPVTLSATSSQQIYWYSAASGGNLLNTGTTFTTPTLISNTSYYVETGTSCRSNRVTVQALIVNIPNVPSVHDTSRCGPGTLVIRATSPVQVNWYDAQLGGNLLGSGYYFTTPSITTSTIFYADAGLGCNSARVHVEADIDSVPPAPTATDSIRCSTGVLTLHANSILNISWYDSNSGGTLVGTGSDFITPFLFSTTVYYAEADNGCQSNRTPVSALIGESRITSITNASSCGSGILTLSAVASVPGDGVLWYDQPGGNIIGQGSTFTTPLLTSSTTYYAVAQSGCIGSATPVNASIHSPILVFLGPDTILLPFGQNIVLDAGAGFSSYSWSTGSNNTSISVSSQGLYSVIVTDGNGCTSTDQVLILISTGIENNAAILPLQVFPNPAHDRIFVKLSDPSSKYLLLKLMSADGKIVRNEKVRSFNGEFFHTLTLSDIAAGIYFLKAENEKSAITLKVIVQ